MRFTTRTGDHQGPLRVGPYLRVLCREQPGIRPVDCRIDAVEKTGLGNQEQTRTGRTNGRACCMPFCDPIRQLGVTARLPAPIADEDRRYDDDIAGSAFDLPVKRRGDAPCKSDRVCSLSEYLDVEGRGVRHAITSDQEGKAVQNVEDSGQRCDCRIRDGDDADPNALRLRHRQISLLPDRYGPFRASFALVRSTGNCEGVRPIRIAQQGARQMALDGHALDSELSTLS